MCGQMAYLAEPIKLDLILPNTKIIPGSFVSVCLQLGFIPKTEITCLTCKYGLDRLRMG